MMENAEQCDQVEHFWRIYNHMQRPNEFKTTTDFHLFKNGIKPTWEDPQNERGGKWMVRLKKGLASRYWEEVVLAIIGEQFDVGQEICGAVVCRLFMTLSVFNFFDLGECET
jgi:translation initiation factor 4E